VQVEAVQPALMQNVSRRFASCSCLSVSLSTQHNSSSCCGWRRSRTYMEGSCECNV